MPKLRSGKSSTDPNPNVGRKPWFKKVRWWLLIALGVCILTVVLGLDPLARAQTRRWLGRIDGYDGDFQDAHLRLFPLTYQVSRLKISKSGTKKEPIFYTEDIAAELSWASLLRGRLIGRLHARGAKVSLEQPPPGGTARLPDLAALAPVPLVIERIQVKAGQVLYVFLHEKYRPSIWFHDIEATLENVGSRPNLVQGPMTLAAQGVLQRSGKMSVFLTADPFATPLTFAGQASIKGFDISEMNQLIDSKFDVKLSSGTFGMRVRFESRRGKLTGILDPDLKLSEVQAHDDALGNKLKAMFARIKLTLSGPPDGTDASGKISFRDDLTEPDRQLLLTVEKVVENAFLLGLEESLRRRYAGHPSEVNDGREGKGRGPPAELKTGG